ncbi:MAG TPA: septal ring lytic transglycosylase RlpA family protein [Thermoanaerobaculia bacterium]|nr:septal ring lytic transglycosylase RlpA family protein [Thermoanaerobaculia bacterium]
MVSILCIAVLQACATSTLPRQASDRLRGTASWYGEEFAGRTTANGEIFDPMRLTAAHRTLPFGTILDVTNPGNGRSVRVRVNDRGPFVGDRILDLSYAAAREIGMVEAGIALIEAHVVELGRGDREPPAPYVVTIDSSSETITAPPQAPSVDFPLPGGGKATVHQSAPAAEDEVVEEVVVIEERAGERVRKRVGADGTTIETVTEDGRVIARDTPRTSPSPRPAPTRPAVPAGSFVVQLGAFQIEANAETLRREVESVEPAVFIERRSGLWRVRIGPFPTREAARARADRLTARGFPGIVLSVE